MRKANKKNLFEIVKTLYDAHKTAQSYMENNDMDTAIALLTECQNAAIGMGENIEASEGDGIPTIACLQEYCEALYQVAVAAEEGGELTSHFVALDEVLKRIECSIEEDIKVRREVVFLPYKASMWDSLESVWKAAAADPDCDAYVVPIPYYDRDKDGSFQLMHYEGDKYPSNVPMVHYESYDFAKRRPDVIYIHNPYDEYNYVTSVDPKFYSGELKKYTECLVYVPYFITGGTLADSFYYCPSYKNMDYIVTQSINHHKFLHPDNGIQRKLLPLGSPKVDKLINCRYDKNDIRKRHGFEEYRGVFFYNTSLSGTLSAESDMLRKTDYVIDTFAKREDVALIWRPHPLMEATLKTLMPQLWEGYQYLLGKAINTNNIFVDVSSGIDTTINLSDAYVGEETSSMMHLFGVTGKPVFITDSKLFTSHEKEKENIMCFCMEKVGEEYWISAGDRNCLLRMDQNGKILETFEIPGEKRDDMRLYNFIAYRGGKLFLTPYKATEIAVFDLITRSFTKIPFDMPGKKSFTKAYFYKENLYMIPGGYDAILQLNVNTLEVIYHKQVIDEIRRETNVSNELITFNASMLVGNTIYMALAGANHIISYNLDNLEVKDWTVGNTDYWCMEGIEGKFLLGSNSGNCLVYWDSVNGEVKEIRPFAEGEDKLSQCYYDMLRFDKDIYVFPKSGSQVLKVNLDTLFVETIELNGEVFINERKNGYYDWPSNTLMAKKQDEESIVIQRAYEYGVDIISVKTGNGRHIPIAIEEEKMPYRWDKLFSSRGENIPWAMRETKLYSLNGFIDYVISGIHNKEKQKEIYSHVVANADGTAGEKIYKTIREKVR